MSQSIFHVRPLDAGKGWAIDEYDGRGAWQRTIPKTPEGAVMDKQQAQRAVFQLRRKALNSATKDAAVNKAACGARCPEEPSWVCRREHGHQGRHESPDGGDWYDAPPSDGPDWSRLKGEVIERIDALAAIHDKLDAPPEWRAKLWNDLALPNLRLLAEFCTNITFTDDEESEVAS
jgi:hypothetical protein